MAVQAVLLAAGSDRSLTFLLPVIVIPVLVIITLHRLWTTPWVANMVVPPLIAVTGLEIWFFIQLGEGKKWALIAVSFVAAGAGLVTGWLEACCCAVERNSQAGPYCCPSSSCIRSSSTDLERRIAAATTDPQLITMSGEELKTPDNLDL